MQIEKKKIRELKLAVYNPRMIYQEDKEKLRNSLKKFGYVEPIIWNKRTGNIVGGNQRFTILMETMNPDDEIEVVVVDMELIKEKALNIALNKISGDWDEKKLGELLGEIDDELIEFTGFDQNQVDNLLSETESAIDDLEYEGESGEQTGIRYCLVLKFATEEDKNMVKDYFKREGTVELDTEKLLELI
jgi:ParB-like chromosome segregation protein Spo0J